MTTQRTRRGIVTMVLLPTMATCNAFIGLLLSILLPALSTSREMTKRTICLTNLSGMGKCCMLYMVEYNDRYPPDLDTFVKEGNDPRLLECPSSPLKGPSYFYLPPTAPADPSGMIACDYYCNHRGMRNVLFSDGHVEVMTDPRFAEAMARPVNARFAQALAAAEGSLRAKRAAQTKP